MAAYVKTKINMNNANLSASIPDGTSQEDLLLSRGVFGISVYANSTGSAIEGTLEGAVGDEIRTDQILTTDAMAIDTVIYFDVANKRLTQVAGAHKIVGIVVEAKDSENWITFRKTRIGGESQ